MFMDSKQSHIVYLKMYLNNIILQSSVLFNTIVILGLECLENYIKIKEDKVQKYPDDVMYSKRRKKRHL